MRSDGGDETAIATANNAVVYRRMRRQAHKRGNPMENKELKVTGEVNADQVTAAGSEGDSKPEVHAEEIPAKEKEAEGAVRKEYVPEVVLQYREYEANIEEVVKRIKAHYYAKGYPENSIESLQVYMKPEDFTAYYVINDGVVGKVNLF